MSEMRQITIVVYTVLIIALLMPITITYSEIAAPPSRQPTTSTNVDVITTNTTPKATTEQQQHFESITIILDDNRVIFNGTKVNMTLIEGKGIAIITTTSGEEIADVFKEEPIPTIPISNVGDLFENE